MLAQGASKETQQAIGTGVFGGMVSATVLAVFFVAGLLCSGAGRAAVDRAAPAQAPADAGRNRGWNGTSLKICMSSS